MRGSTLPAGIDSESAAGPMRWLSISQGIDFPLRTRDALGMIRGVLFAIPFATMLWAGIALLLLRGL